MKTLRFTAVAAILSIVVITSCSKQSSSGKDYSPVQQSTAVSAEAGRKPITSTTGTPDAYSINLDSHTQLPDGNWEWIWSIQNSNPGNGNNGTVQNMSHWGMQFGNCVSSSSFVSAAYSADGSNWNSFSPSYSVDPSQSCMTTPVLKFDFGTQGSAYSYYRLVVNQNYLVGNSQGYYKSGNNTGCNTFTFTGISCFTEIPVR